MKPLYVKKNGTVNKVSGVAMPNTFPANRVGYDNTESELEATNTQDAIDEVVDIVADKVDKVSSATNGNLAGLDASGNLTDSGVSSSTLEAITNVYGSKNLFEYSFLQSQTYSDLTLTINADKSISISGTNNSGSTKVFYCRDVALPIQKGSYIISGGLSSENPVKVHFYYGQDGNSNITLTDEETNLDFSTINIVNFTIHVPNATTVNTIIYPMIRDARISDDTYTPYAKTNLELTKDTSAIEAIVNLYGSKNLFPDFIESQTYKGITWTRNADTSITVNGTAEGWSTCVYGSSIKLKAGTYVLSSGLSWPACYDVYAELNYNDGISHVINTSLAEEVTFTLANDTEIPTVQVVVRSNKTVSNITIKPMIRDARILDSTYVPYAMTNRELTEKVGSMLNKTLQPEKYYTISDFNTCLKGGIYFTANYIATSNAPRNNVNDSCLMIVSAASQDMVVQLVFSTYRNDAVYYRVFNGTTFSNWITIKEP